MRFFYARMWGINARTTPSLMPGPGWRRLARNPKNQNQHKSPWAHHLSPTLSFVKNYVFLLGVRGEGSKMCSQAKPPAPLANFFAQVPGPGESPREGPGNACGEPLRAAAGASCQVGGKIAYRLCRIKPPSEAPGRAAPR